LLNTLLYVDAKGKDSISAHFSRENTRFNAVDLRLFHQSFFMFARLNIYSKHLSFQHRVFVEE